MRVFFGVEIDADNQEKIFLLSRRVMPCSESAQFTTQGNYHVTIKFLGDMGGLTAADFSEPVLKSKEKGLPSVLLSLLEQATLSIEPFELIFDAIGCFHKKKKHVLWLGGPAQLSFELLTQKFEEVTTELPNLKIGVVEKPVMHVTLARGKSFEMDDLRELQFEPIKLQVNRISLFESCRVENRLTYRSIASICLINRGFEYIHK